MHGAMAYTVVESCFWTLWVGWQRLWMPDEVLALDGIVHLVHGDFEWSEVCFVPMSFGEISSLLVDSSDCLTWYLLGATGMCLLFLRFAPCLGERLAET